MWLVVWPRERELLKRSGVGFVNIYSGGSVGSVCGSREEAARQAWLREWRPAYRVKITCKAAPQREEDQ